MICTFPDSSDLRVKILLSARKKKQLNCIVLIQVKLRIKQTKAKKKNQKTHKNN